MASKSDVLVVLPVYNSLHVVRRCVNSVLRFSDPVDYRLAIVNDGSDSVTTAELEAWESRYSEISVFHNDRNIGYLRSCNLLLEEASEPVAVVLNSDTCVTPRWLQKILGCFRSDSSIGIGSPVSNFAPHMKVDMVPGWDYLQMGALVESVAQAEYPDITTPEGFCFAISRECLCEVGKFDEVFDEGYGEESDLAMRAVYRGFRTVCIDDTFIYHQGRGTFGQEQRDRLYQQNKGIFHDRWGPRYRRDFAEFQERDPIEILRDRVAWYAPDNIESAFKRGA